ncbi:MAG: hypothetical protein ACNA8W_01325 [Bradymonadaceae bacterium]
MRSIRPYHLAILTVVVLTLSNQGLGAEAVIEVKDDEVAQLNSPEPQTSAPERAVDESVDVQGIDESELQQGVRAFTDFVDRFEHDERWRREAGVYAERGTRLFVFAIGLLIPDDDANLGERYRLLYEMLGDVEDVPGVENTPHYLSEALIEGAELLSAVQERYYPQFVQLVDGIPRAAEAIDIRVAPSDQIQQVYAFLTQAASALERIANAPPTFVGGGPLENGETGVEPTPGPIIMHPGEN